MESNSRNIIYNSQKLLNSKIFRENKFRLNKNQDVLEIEPSDIYENTWKFYISEYDKANDYPVKWVNYVSFNYKDSENNLNFCKNEESIDESNFNLSLINVEYNLKNVINDDYRKIFKLLYQKYQGEIDHYVPKKLIQKSSQKQVSLFLDNYGELENDLNTGLKSLMVKSLTDNQAIEINDIKDKFLEQYNQLRESYCDNYFEIERIFMEFENNIQILKYEIRKETVFLFIENTLSKLFRSFKQLFLESPLIQFGFEYHDLIFSFKDLISLTKNFRDYILLISKSIYDERKRNYRIIRVPC